MRSRMDNNDWEEIPTKRDDTTMEDLRRTRAGELFDRECIVAIKMPPSETETTELPCKTP